MRRSWPHCFTKRPFGRQVVIGKTIWTICTWCMEVKRGMKLMKKDFLVSSLWIVLVIAWSLTAPPNPIVTCLFGSPTLALCIGKGNFWADAYRSPFPYSQSLSLQKWSIRRIVRIDSRSKIPPRWRSYLLHQRSNSSRNLIMLEICWTSVYSVPVPTIWLYIVHTTKGRIYRIPWGMGKRRKCVAKRFGCHWKDMDHKRRRWCILWTQNRYHDSRFRRQIPSNSHDPTRLSITTSVQPSILWWKRQHTNSCYCT